MLLVHISVIVSTKGLVTFTECAGELHLTLVKRERERLNVVVSNVLFFSHIASQP